jgi:hypothetical protein
MSSAAQARIRYGASGGESRLFDVGSIEPEARPRRLTRIAYAYHACAGDVSAPQRVR